MAEKNKKTGEKEAVIDKNIKKYAPFLIWLGVLAVVFIVLLLLFHGTGKVEYKGLSFTREKYGEVLVYHYYYFAELASGKVRKVDILLRGNPAENKVPVEGKIVYPEGKTVYMSINPGLEKCEDSLIAIGAFSMFISNNDIPFKGGLSDKEEAQAENQTYVTCEEYPNNMVLSLKTGNESKITLTDKHCYNLEVANCDILPVMEKLIVQSILDAKEKA